MVQVYLVVYLFTSIVLPRDCNRSNLDRVQVDPNLDLFYEGGPRFGYESANLILSQPRSIYIVSDLGPSLLLSIWKNFGTYCDNDRVLHFN